MNLNPRSPIMGLKLIRRSLRRSWAAIQSGPLTGSPILFGNSFPKSGTHLLTQVLLGFSQLGPAVDSGLPAIVTFDGPSGKPRAVSSILKDINRLKDGDIGYGHLHAIPEVISEMIKKGMVSFFIFRDPRDVVVSHVHYVTEMEPDHVHHDYYTQTLETFDDRLMVSILGRLEIKTPFPNIQERFTPFVPWLDIKGVLPLRFEDLINHRESTLEAILDHVIEGGFPLRFPRHESLQILGSGINPEKSPTFRSGTPGKWRESFSDEHKATFKEIAGDMLIQLGYEEDFDW
jgi:hypothetical protein